MATVSNFESITKWAGQNDKKMISQMLNGLDFLPQVRVLRNASSHGVLLPKMTVSKGIRPLNINVNTPKGTNRNFSGRKLFVYGAMKIIDMIPEEARKTFLDNQLDPNAKQLPFAQWIWEQEMKMIGTEINDTIYLSEYKADAAAYSAVAAYIAGTDVVNFEEKIYACIINTLAGESPTTAPASWNEITDTVISEGWGTIIAKEIVAAKIAGNNLIATGAISSANAWDKVKLMYRSMPAAHRKIGGVFYVAPDVYDMYIDAEKTEFNNVAQPADADGRKFIHGSGKKWLIEEATWMGTSGRIIATQKENLVFGTHLASDLNKLGKTIETLHGTSTIAKWLQGCEFSDLETLYVNDQA